MRVLSFNDHVHLVSFGWYLWHNGILLFLYYITQYIGFSSQSFSKWSKSFNKTYYKFTVLLITNLNLSWYWRFDIKNMKLAKLLSCYWLFMSVGIYRLQSNVKMQGCPQINKNRQVIPPEDHEKSKRTRMKKTWHWLWFLQVIELYKGLN